jgi:hypothetical protein
MGVAPLKGGCSVEEGHFRHSWSWSLRGRRINLQYGLADSITAGIVLLACGELRPFQFEHSASRQILHLPDLRHRVGLCGEDSVMWLEVRRIDTDRLWHLYTLRQIVS